MLFCFLIYQSILPFLWDLSYVCLLLPIPFYEQAALRAPLVSGSLEKPRLEEWVKNLGRTFDLYAFPRPQRLNLTSESTPWPLIHMLQYLSPHLITEKMTFNRSEK